MPETRYRTLISYPPDIPVSEKTVANARANGWVVQIPYEVSDEQLAQEQLGRDANDAAHRCAEGLANWDTLTSSAQKALLKDVLIVIKLFAIRQGLL